MFASIIAGSTGTARNAAVTAAEPQPLALNLRLSGVERLPRFSTPALQNEVESIWRPSPVRVRWLGTKAEAVQAPALTVLVTPKAVASCCADGARWTVGELLRFEGPTAIAVASITGAQRVVHESTGFRFVDSQAFREHQLGVVLGRAVAHEIGHYVLQTNTHATYGLMRANIDAREFADFRRDSFRLDRAADAYLSVLAARGAIFDRAHGGDTFSYPAP